jgi:hypothetical protein
VSFYICCYLLYLYLMRCLGLYKRGIMYSPKLPIYLKLSLSCLLLSILSFLIVRLYLCSFCRRVFIHSRFSKYLFCSFIGITFVIVFFNLVFCSSVKFSSFIVNQFLIIYHDKFFWSLETSGPPPLQ